MNATYLKLRDAESYKLRVERGKWLEVEEQSLKACQINRVFGAVIPSLNKV